jgi:hypothetical protein
VRFESAAIIMAQTHLLGLGYAKAAHTGGSIEIPRIRAPRAIGVAVVLDPIGDQEAGRSNSRCRRGPFSRRRSDRVESDFRYEKERCRAVS